MMIFHVLVMLGRRLRKNRAVARITPFSVLVLLLLFLLRRKEYFDTIGGSGNP